MMIFYRDSLTFFLYHAPSRPDIIVLSTTGIGEMFYWIYKKEKSELLMSFWLGAIFGAACGIAILSFNSLIGRSRTTGTEYVGYWDWGVLGVGIMYGSFLGILLAPLGYIIFLRNIGLRKAIFPAFLGTIIGGFLGAFTGPFEALYYGCLGFFLSLFGLWLFTHVIGRKERIRLKG